MERDEGFGIEDILREEGAFFVSPKAKGEAPDVSSAFLTLGTLAGLERSGIEELLDEDEIGADATAEWVVEEVSCRQVSQNHMPLG